MGPADLLDYDRDHLVGLVLEDAGVSAHVTIIARALGLATVGGATGIVNKVQAGEMIGVDGLTGKVHMSPSKKSLVFMATRLCARKSSWPFMKACVTIPACGHA